MKSLNGTCDLAELFPLPVDFRRELRRIVSLEELMKVHLSVLKQDVVVYIFIVFTTSKTVEAETS